MKHIDKHEIAERALSRKYSNIWTWHPTEILMPHGPDDMPRVLKFNEDLQRAKSLCIEALLALDEPDFRRIAAFAAGSDIASDLNWHALLPVDLNVLKRRLPPRIAYGFGHPAFAPDYQYWSSMPKLSLHEATLLSVGAKPDFITRQELNQIAAGQMPIRWAALAYLAQRYRELFRIFPSGETTKRPMATHAFYDKATAADIQIHPLFEEALARPTPDAKSKKRPTSEIKTIEMDSLLKLIAGMAVEQYGFDPTASRSPAIQNISSDLDGLGISLDQKTIRKWVKKSCELIDQSYFKK